MKRMSVLLLVLLAVGLTVSRSADHPCSVADLNGDCNVDLRDYAMFQTAFSGTGAFELVGPTWDVFYLDNRHGWTYTTSFVFYHNGTVWRARDEEVGTFFFYDVGGETITVQFGIKGDGDCGNEQHPYMDFSFLSADELVGATICNGAPIESLRALRRF